MGIMHETNEVVAKHFLIGGQTLLPYKKIIQRCTYPVCGGSWSLEMAKDAIDAFTTSGGTKRDQFELQVFFLECGIHFASDFEFYEEDENIVLEEMFESTLKSLVKEDKSIGDLYIPRMKALVEAATDYGGLCDQLEDYWQEAFGK